jgi:hypothetical protein
MKYFKNLSFLLYISVFCSFICMLLDLPKISAILFLASLSIFIIHLWESLRDGMNIFKFYLFYFPLIIILQLFFIVTISIWLYAPIYFYFSKNSSIYYTILLPLLGGAIGEIIWIILYVVFWGYISYTFFQVIEKKLKRIKKYLKDKFIQPK